MHKVNVPSVYSLTGLSCINSIIIIINEKRNPIVPLHTCRLTIAAIVPDRSDKTFAFMLTSTTMKP